ncbi:MAG TPA: hypothetical protein VFD74_05710, partial [Thermoleophilia bacterium]|nr:hypothetical protein [Thermoleophilia bacterium]
VLVLAIIIGGAAFVAFGTDRTPWDFGGALRTTRIDGPASAGVREAEARIDVGAARIDIASSRGGVMTEGTLESRRDPQVTHNVSNGVYTLEVLQKKGVQIFHSGIQGDRLVLDLAQGVPWKIDVDTGAADANLDLRGVTLSELTVDAGASSLDLTLGPDIVGGARVSVDGGAGSYRLRLPRDLDITLTIDAGVSSVNVDGAFQRTGDVYRLAGAGAGEALSVDINAGVSSISVELY